MEFKFTSSDKLRHSAAHVLAASVKRIFPNVKVGIGPVTKNGFFYDFDIDEEISDSDIENIQNEIDKLIDENLTFQQVQMTRETALNVLMQAGQIYKAELLQQIQDPTVSFYKLGSEFTDLCRGPHINKTSELGIIKIDSIKKVYWQDKKDRPQLTRIYAKLFSNLEELNEYNKFIESTQKNNFISRGISSNIYLKIKKDSNILILSEKGNLLRKNIINHIENSIRKKIDIEHLMPSIDITTHKKVNKPKKLADWIFKNNSSSYKNFPKCFAITELIENIEEDIQYTNENINYLIYFDSSKQQSFLTSVLIELTNIFKVITKNEVKIDIETEDFKNSNFENITNFFSKNVISHNKILVKDTYGDLDININGCFGSAQEKIGKLAFFDKSSKVFFTSVDNKQKELSCLIIQINVSNIIKFLLEAFNKDFPFILKPIQVVFIPQNKKLNDDVIYFINKFKNLLNINYTIDVSSKSINTKIKNAEENSVEYICVIGEKELKNNAISVRKENQLIGLVNVDKFIELINTPRENQFYT